MKNQYLLLFMFQTYIFEGEYGGGVLTRTAFTCSHGGSVESQKSIYL